MKNNSKKHLNYIKMKNKIVKILENFGYLIAICVGTMLVYVGAKFAFYIMLSVYDAMTK